MSGSVNRAIILGTLGRDPECRTFPSGDRVVNFSVATKETWRDKNTGERKDKTEWHNVSVFNENLGKIAEQYLKKGASVYLEGQIQTRKYTDRDGNERQSTEIVLPKFGGALVLLGDKKEPRSDSYADRRDPKPLRDELSDDVPS